MISPSVTISRFSFGISRPMTVLPGMTSTTRTLMHRQRAREVLGERGDLARLHAGRRPQLEARDDRARLHGHDLDFDAEVLELHLDQPRHRLERLGASSSGSRGGGSSSSFSGGSSFALGGSNMRHLPLRSTRALFSTIGLRRLDARRRARRRLLLLGLAPLPCAPARARALRLHRARMMPSARAATPPPPRRALPSRSMIVSQDTPKASDSPAIQAAISSSVAPRKLRPAASPLPTACRGRRRRVWRRLPGCSAASSSPQLADEHQHEPARCAPACWRASWPRTGCAAAGPSRRAPA